MTHALGWSAISMPTPPRASAAQILPGGAYAVHTHVGPYDQMGDIMSKLHTSLVQKRGLSVDYDRSFMTIYLNDPALTREMHRRTELCVPVLPIRMPLSGNDDHEGTSSTTSTAWPARSATSKPLSGWLSRRSLR